MVECDEQHFAVWASLSRVWFFLCRPYSRSATTGQINWKYIDHLSDVRRLTHYGGPVIPSEGGATLMRAAELQSPSFSTSSGRRSEGRTFFCLGNTLRRRFGPTTIIPTCCHRLCLFLQLRIQHIASIDLQKGSMRKKLCKTLPGLLAHFNFHEQLPTRIYLGEKYKYYFIFIYIVTCLLCYIFYKKIRCVCILFLNFSSY